MLRPVRFHCCREHLPHLSAPPCLSVPWLPHNPARSAKKCRGAFAQTRRSSEYRARPVVPSTPRGAGSHNASAREDLRFHSGLTPGFQPSGAKNSPSQPPKLVEACLSTRQELHHLGMRRGRCSLRHRAMRVSAALSPPMCDLPNRHAQHHTVGGRVVRKAVLPEG